MGDTAQVLINDFPGLSELDEDAKSLLERGAQAVTVPQGATIFSEGSACEAYLMVLEGSVRVHKVAESGREIVLYRVEKGQTCVLTTSCLMMHSDYGAEGVAETEVKAVALKGPTFQSLLASSSVFRDFVFSSYATRISDLLMLIEEVAFGRIDVRLAQCLLLHGGTGGQVKRTHQDLAIELGSAREVVSRQLKEFEHKGWVSLGRGAVTIKDQGALSFLGKPGSLCD